MFSGYHQPAYRTYYPGFLLLSKATFIKVNYDKFIDGTGFSKVDKTFVRQ